ncbi:MAG: hypothetical protein ACOY3I_06735 [Verrucomicrobiota bacterium]
MKKILVVVFLAGFAFSNVQAAHVSVRIGDHHKGERHHHSMNHHRHWPSRPHYWHRPLWVHEPIIFKEVVYTGTCDQAIPYGYMRGGKIKSPWSDFTVSAGGKTSGEIIYDANTGQAFRVP